MKHSVTAYNTKKLLAEALKKAMQGKPFSKITVSELIRACGVNRKTFYYHFQDIYDLLKWMLDEEAVQVVRHFDLLTDYESAIRFVMDYTEQNDYLVSCAADPVGREEIKRFFYQDFTDIVLSVIDGATLRTSVTLEPELKAYAARFYTNALASMLIEWLLNRNTQDREQTIRHLTYTVGTAINGMLAQMERRRP